MKYLQVHPCYLGTRSDPTKLTAGKKRKLCTRYQKSRTLALALPREVKTKIKAKIYPPSSMKSKEFLSDPCVNQKYLSWTSINRWCHWMGLRYTLTQRHYTVINFLYTFELCFWFIYFFLFYFTLSLWFQDIF